MRQTRLEPFGGFTIPVLMEGRREGKCVRGHGVDGIVTNGGRFGEKIGGDRLRRRLKGDASKVSGTVTKGRPVSVNTPLPGSAHCLGCDWPSSFAVG